MASSMGVAQVTWKGLCTILVAWMVTLSSDMILYFVLKWVYGTPVSLAVSEVQTKIALHNNDFFIRSSNI